MFSWLSFAFCLEFVRMTLHLLILCIVVFTLDGWLCNVLMSCVWGSMLFLFVLSLCSACQHFCLLVIMRLIVFILCLSICSFCTRFLSVACCMCRFGNHFRILHFRQLLFWAGCIIFPLLLEVVTLGTASMWAAEVAGAHAVIGCSAVLGYFCSLRVAGSHLWLDVLASSASISWQWAIAIPVCSSSGIFGAILLGCRHCVFPVPDVGISGVSKVILLCHSALAVLKKFSLLSPPHQGGFLTFPHDLQDFLSHEDFWRMLV